MYDFFARTSGWAVLATFMIVPAVAAMALHALFRRIVPAQRLLPHQEVAGFLVAVVGVLYAVVLGFLVISVWSSFDQAQRNADAETTAISNVLYLNRTLPEDTRRRQRRLLGQYAFEVRDVEWPMLANGEEDVQARALMVGALETAASMRIPVNADQSEVLRLSSLRASMLDSYRDLAAHRRLRVLDAQAHVQQPMYFAIVAGGLILLAFVFLFGVDNLFLQLVMTGLVAAMIGLQVGVIFEMDRPFWGAIHVTSDAWTLLIQDNHLSEP